MEHQRRKREEKEQGFPTVRVAGVLHTHFAYAQHAATACFFFGTPATAKKISALPDEEKTLVLKMITAYIRDFNTQQAYAS